MLDVQRGKKYHESFNGGEVKPRPSTVRGTSSLKDILEGKTDGILRMSEALASLMELEGCISHRLDVKRWY